jgi:NAD(P)H-nitrite reductase large subunit
VEDGRSYPFGALLIATGADPVRLTVPGSDGPNVRYLRTLADSNAVIAKASSVKRAIVVGASFIGLEVAASLRERGLNVQVVAPESRPMERVLGPEVGEFVQSVHESLPLRASDPRPSGRDCRCRVLADRSERGEEFFARNIRVWTTRSPNHEIIHGDNPG